MTLWTVALLAPLSVGFSRQEYWSRLPFSPPGDLPHPRTEPMSPESAGRFFTTGSPGKLKYSYLTMLSPVFLEPCLHPGSYEFSRLIPGANGRVDRECQSRAIKQLLRPRVRLKIKVRNVERKSTRQKPC